MSQIKLSNLKTKSQASTSVVKEVYILGMNLGHENARAAEVTIGAKEAIDQIMVNAKNEDEAREMLKDVREFTLYFYKDKDGNVNQGNVRFLEKIQEAFNNDTTLTISTSPQEDPTKPHFLNPMRSTTNLDAIMKLVK